MKWSQISKQLYTLGFLLIFLLTFSLVYALGTTDTGYRANKSTVTTVDAWEECRNVDNSGTDDYFVPTKSSQEWGTFRAVADADSLPGISTTECQTCDDVDIGGETICLEDGATAGGFSLPCIWYFTGSGAPDARARYLNGKLQTRASRGWAGCDSGWQDGPYAECNSWGNVRTTTTVNGVKSDIYIDPFGSFFYVCSSPTMLWNNP